MPWPARPVVAPPRGTHQWWWVVSTVVSFTPYFLTVSTTCNQTGGSAQAGYAPGPSIGLQVGAPGELAGLPRLQDGRAMRRPFLS